MCSTKGFWSVAIDQFYPEHTDDPVEPPTQQLTMLAETVARMREEAESPGDRIAKALAERHVARPGVAVAEKVHDNDH